MAEYTFTIDDIKQFLQSIGYKWNSYIFDREEGSYRKLKLQDFKPYKVVLLDVSKQTEKGTNLYMNIPVVIANDGFNILGVKDYSKDWKKYINKKQQTEQGYEN